MKNQTIVSIAVLMFGTHALGQDVSSPMRLSPVEIEDVGDPPGQPEMRRNEVDSLPPARSFLPGVTNKPTDNRRQLSVTQEEISRLNRPLAEIQLSGLAKSPPPLVGLDAEEVSQLGFTRGPGRLITAGGLGTSASLETVTTYCRRSLYFEDCSLERCGESDGCLPVGCWTNCRSAAKFLVDTALLPYRMIKRHPDELVIAVAE